MARGRAPAASADRVLADLHARLKRESWPAGLTVLTGDDLYHLDAAQRALIETLVPDESAGFALSVFDGDPVDVSKIVAAVRSRPMFSPRRVVLVRELRVFDGEPEPLVAFAKNPPEDSHLLVRAPSLDKRRKFHKLLAELGTTLTFSLDSAAAGPRLVALVAGLAKERGLRIERTTAAFLVEVCGGDFYRVTMELDKLRGWMGDVKQGRVTLDELRQVAFGSGQLTSWEAADALLTRDAGRALAAVRELIGRGDPPLQMLGGLAFRGRSMLQAKAMLESGAGHDQIVRAVRAWYWKDQLTRGLAHYSLAELRRFPSLLREADRTLKSRSIHPRAILETLVERMIGIPGAASGGAG